MRLLLLLLLSLCYISPIIGKRSRNPITSLIYHGRRILNFSSTFGTPSKSSQFVYERIAGHPVFSVTTPWGSPYLNIEKISNDETIPDNDTGKGSNSNKVQSLSEEQSEIRMVALYFLDPADVMGLHGEMKQIDTMQRSDLRITSFSLSKAIRQASNLGRGLCTGMPPEPTNGRLSDDNGSLRYKLVPPKKQLYYAARCIGKERVGLWSDSPAEDAINAIMGNSAIEASNLLRRRDKFERKTPKQYTPIQYRNKHMEGYTGIPVFYCHNMQKKLPIIKQFITGTRQEIPLFFNYEDLQIAYEKMRNKKSSAKKLSIIPNEPIVEVFNLWDVLSSMDRTSSISSEKSNNNPFLNAIRNRMIWKSSCPEPTLQDIIFIPNSDSVQYKDTISRRGNGKARLPPMR